jgi:hypothetical protein
MRDRLALILLSLGVSHAASPAIVCSDGGVRFRYGDCKRDGGDTDFEQSAMESAQAGDDAGWNALARQLGAVATQTCDAAATTEETANGGGSAPVILQASKATLMQQFRWQRQLGECSALLCGEELARQVIGLGSGMNHTRHNFLSLLTSTCLHLPLGARQHNDFAQIRNGGGRRLAVRTVTTRPSRTNRKWGKRSIMSASPQLCPRLPTSLGRDLMLIEQDRSKRSANSALSDDIARPQGSPQLHCAVVKRQPASNCARPLVGCLARVSAVGLTPKTESNRAALYEPHEFHHPLIF